MLEEVEDELLGERDCKDAGGPGEAPTDELLVSGVCPAKTQAHTNTQKEISGTQCECFYISD